MDIQNRLISKNRTIYSRNELESKIRDMRYIEGRPI